LYTAYIHIYFNRKKSFNVLMDTAFILKEYNRHYEQSNSQLKYFKFITDFARKYCTYIKNK